MNEQFSECLKGEKFTEDDCAKAAVVSSDNTARELNIFRESRLQQDHENYREILKIFHGTSHERGASDVTSLAPALPALPEYIGMYTYPYSGGQALVLAVARRDHGVGGGRGGGQYVML